MFNYFKNKIKSISKKFIHFKYALGSRIKALFSQGISDQSLDELEKLLYEADLGVECASSLVEHIKNLSSKQQLKIDDIIKIIERELLNILPTQIEEHLDKKPFVILIVGVNGSGKTTSIAKLANMYKKQNKKVLIAAADTFRAAAVQQLSTWANKLNIDIIKSQEKADPSSVVYDALIAAKARDADIVLIDTAGRLQNKQDLMNELEKMKRVCNKLIENSPHKIYLTLDATMGQNAVDQAEAFHNLIKIDGIVLSKLDGTAKGGIVIAIQKKLNIPVVWTGVGEKIDDLIPFDSNDFVKQLLAVEE